MKKVGKLNLGNIKIGDVVFVDGERPVGYRRSRTGRGQISGAAYSDYLEVWGVSRRFTVSRPGEVVVQEEEVLGIMVGRINGRPESKGQIYISAITGDMVNEKTGEVLAMLDTVRVCEPKGGK